MIADLSWSAWMGVGLALLLFFSPGAAFMTIWSGRWPVNALLWTALTIALACTFWPLLLVVLLPLGVRLDVFSVYILGVLALAVVIWSIWHRRAAWPRPTLAEWGIIAIALLAGLLCLWSIRFAVGGLGSDSYHHTLVTQLILDRGGIPDNYLPYAPLVSFSYHFGSHAATAVVAWLSGLPARLTLPIFGQVYEIAAILSVAALTYLLTDQLEAAFVATLVVGFVSVFPAYFINWGRYPQLAGLVIMPLFLGLLWQWLKNGQEWHGVILLGYLAAGLTLIHYRVVLMTAIGSLAMGMGWWLLCRPGLAALRTVAGRLAMAAGLALVLVAPWLWHVQVGQARGVSVVLSEPLPSVFSLERLGPHVMAYPTNGAMVALIVAAVAWGLWRRDLVILMMVAWSASLWLASGPQLVGRNMDTVTVFISLYIPAGVCTGWAVVRWIEWIDREGRWRRPVAIALGLGLGAVALVGAWNLRQIGNMSEAYVGPEDLRAAAWIASNTPVGARFLVNLFTFEFWPDFVVGSDAGTWLPLLAGRQAAALPMTYNIERVLTGAEPDELEELLKASHTLTDPKSVAQVKAAGITHLYLGERGGPLTAQVSALLASPAYERVYHFGKTAVFRVR